MARAQFELRPRGVLSGRNITFRPPFLLLNVLIRFIRRVVLRTKECGVERVESRKTHPAWEEHGVKSFVLRRGANPREIAGRVGLLCTGFVASAIHSHVYRHRGDLPVKSWEYLASLPENRGNLPAVMRREGIVTPWFMLDRG